MSIIGYLTTTLNWFGFFGTLFFSYFYFLKFRHKERVLLIEKDVNIAELFKRKKRFPWHILSYTLLGIAVGVFVGIVFFIEILGKDGESETVTLLILSITLFFSALGIIIGNTIENKKK